MRKKINHTISPAFHASAVALLLALATATPSSAANFIDSCENFGLQGTTLTASCRQVDINRNAKMVPASINLDSIIGNTNGILTWGGSNFSSTCKNIQLKSPGFTPKGSRPPKEAILQADCTQMQVMTVANSLNLDERIYNNNGTLVYR